MRESILMSEISSLIVVVGNIKNRVYKAKGKRSFIKKILNGCFMRAFVKILILLCMYSGIDSDI
jgi:Na+/H+ antiporter NhaD/arsenite permease-like protein